MRDRSTLQTLLEETLGSDKVYFQPPPDLQMSYPAIVYNRENPVVRHANNRPYHHTKGYEVTVISSNPDSKIPDRVAALPMCAFQRSFETNGFNHTVFTLYF